MKLTRLAWMAALPLLLLAGWLYLYTHTRTVDTEAQQRTHVLLEVLKQHDSDWSVDVLRSHADLNPNYDALVEPLQYFAEASAQLQAQAAPLHDAPLDAALTALARAVEQKSTLIDAFKAQNSLYKNSLRYVPTAHRAIDAEAGRARTADDWPHRLAFLVNESLRYAAVPDGEPGAALVDELAAWRRVPPVPPAWREPVLNLTAHLDTLLRARARQAALLRDITQVPVSGDIDALHEAFARRFNLELAEQFRQQRLLLAYSAIALLLVMSGTAFIGWRNATERARLRALVDEKTRELSELATRDELTRVHNRRHLGELLAQHQALHARNGQPLCVALLDIDLFKSINDRHGHAAGDAVLVRFAAIARRTLRSVDLLGRWGGEEFLIALPATPPAQAEAALQRIRAALQAADFSDVCGDQRVSFSGGLVQLQADETIGAAIERADQAMYRAKTGGRDRIELG